MMQRLALVGPKSSALQGALVTSFNLFSAPGNKATAFPSDGLLLVITSLLPIVLSQSLIKLRAFPEKFAASQSKPHLSPSPWRTPLPSSATHLVSYF